MDNWKISYIRPDQIKPLLMSTETELVLALKNNDINSFDQLFRLYSSRLFFFAKGFLKNRQDAEEIVQDVFIKVWEHRADLDEFRSIRSFLFTIAHRAMIDGFRKKERENLLLKKVKLDQSELDDETQQKLQYDSIKEQVDKMVEMMPPKRKLIYKLSREEGLSHQEIADKLNISKNTIENQIAEALKFLRSKLDRDSLLLLFYFALFHQL